MKCCLIRLWKHSLDCCRKPLCVLCLVPFSFTLPISAEQPHSHSSSLSSVELVSASDDIHRFSTQVLYLVKSEHLYLQRDAIIRCFPPTVRKSMRMSTDESFRIPQTFPSHQSITWCTKINQLDKINLPGGTDRLPPSHNTADEAHVNPIRALHSLYLPSAHYSCLPQ